jgi:hypothetical protein
MTLIQCSCLIQTPYSSLEWILWSQHHPAFVKIMCGCSFWLSIYSQMCLFVSLHLNFYERLLYIVHQPSITSPRIKSKLNQAANTRFYKREDGEVSYGWYLISTFPICTVLVDMRFWDLGLWGPPFGLHNIIQLSLYVGPGVFQILFEIFFSSH